MVYGKSVSRTVPTYEGGSASARVFVLRLSLGSHSDARCTGDSSTVSRSDVIPACAGRSSQLPLKCISRVHGVTFPQGVHETRKSERLLARAGVPDHSVKSRGLALLLHLGLALPVHTGTTDTWDNGVSAPLLRQARHPLQQGLPKHSPLWMMVLTLHIRMASFMSPRNSKGSRWAIR